MNISVFLVDVMNPLVLCFPVLSHVDLWSKLFNNFWTLIGQDWISLAIFQLKLSLIVVVSPLGFLLSRVHNTTTTVIRMIKTPQTDANKGVTIFFFSFLFSLHWSDSHRYGFWPTLKWMFNYERFMFQFSLNLTNHLYF